MHHRILCQKTAACVVPGGCDKSILSLELPALLHKENRLVGPCSTWPNEKGQRRKPAAPDVRFVSERNGWLPFAAPSGWVFLFVLEASWLRTRWSSLAKSL